VKAEDVELSDPATQAFIQSDLFHRIQSDAEFRKAALSGDLNKYIALEARAVELSRAAIEMSRAADAAKAVDVSARALEVAKAADGEEHRPRQDARSRQAAPT
jgi:hypothetical protein